MQVRVEYAPNLARSSASCRRVFDAEPPAKTLWLHHSNRTLCIVGKGFQSRAKSTVALIAAAVARAQIRGEVLPVIRRLSWHIHDATCDTADFAFASLSPSCREALMPDFTFEHWREAGVNNYTDTVAAVREHGLRTAESKRCGWAGHPGLHPDRKRFWAIAKRAPTVLEAIVPGMDIPGRLSHGEMVQRWDCLIDLRGHGFSARVPLLLHSGRPLLFLDRGSLSVWYQRPSPKSGVPPLRAWEHYIPVAAITDIENCSRKVHTSEGWDNATRMAARAAAFAQTYLTRSAAADYLWFELVRVARSRLPGNRQAEATPSRSYSALL